MRGKLSGKAAGTALCCSLKQLLGQTRAPLPAPAPQAAGGHEQQRCPCPPPPQNPERCISPCDLTPTVSQKAPVQAEA